MPSASAPSPPTRVGLAPWLGLVLVLGVFETGSLAEAIHRPLLLPDEPREAAITLEMTRSGTWAVPTLNGVPFVEKPPLLYAASALASRILGSDAVGVLRLPHLLATLATLGALLALGRRLGSPAAGVSCALLLATMVEFWRTSLRLVVDPGLLACTSWAVLATVEWWLAERRGARIGWWVALCVFLGLGVATKGPVALAFHGSAALGLLAFGGRPALRRLLWLAPAYLLSLSPLGVWALALQAEGGRELVSEALVRNSWGRFARAELGHRAPPWFYLRVLPGVLAPWTLLAWAGVPRAWRGARTSLPDSARATVERVALGWALGSILVLSISTAKRELYLLPSLPAWAFLGGAVLEDARRLGRFEGFSRGAMLATLVFLAVASALGGALLWRYDGRGGLLLWPVALFFGALAVVARVRWTAGSQTALFAAVALAAAGVAPWLAEREGAHDSIEAARSALAEAGAGIERVYGLGLRERDISVLSLALGRDFSQLDDLAELGSPRAPLAPRTLLVSVGEGPPVLGPELLGRFSIDAVGSAPLGSQKVYFCTLVKRE